MEHEQALIIGKRRRADAMHALTWYLNERAGEVCAVKPAKDAGVDSRDWDPVGEESYKEICIRTSLAGDREVYLLVVDGDGTAKAMSARAYPLAIALQIARAMPLPVYAGRAGSLIGELHEESLRKAELIRQTP